MSYRVDLLYKEERNHIVVRIIRCGIYLQHNAPVLPFNQPAVEDTERASSAAHMLTQGLKVHAGGKLRLVVLVNQSRSSEIRYRPAERHLGDCIIALGLNQTAGVIGEVNPHGLYVGFAKVLKRGILTAAVCSVS